MPNFTQDWFSHNIPGLKQILPRLPARKRFLEIGCFEGIGTCWFLVHHLDEDGKMYCVDTFEGGADHVVTQFEGVKERFQANIDEVRKPGQEVIVLSTFSHRALSKLIADGLEGEFDLIYVDGSHLAPDVIVDASLGYHLLKVGGIMVFDDYMWGADKPLLDTPKPAVDAFTAFYRDRISTIMLSYQLAIQKNR
jgi:predicted O-methyltransferase YrrM